MATRLVQLQKDGLRRVALVEGSSLRLLADVSSIYALGADAIGRGVTLSEAAKQKVTPELLDYDSIYDGNSEWRILPAIDHPEEPARWLVSGTGLTHLGSARDRQAMHERIGEEERLEELTDSMKMFRWGLDGGRPAHGQIGTAPEWFYKGTGIVLRAHGEDLEVPTYAEDGGEEAEVAGVYLIAPDGRSMRLGMTVGNEFSDHCFEKRNYLNLAGSKLRTCSIGPELVVDPEFSSVPGEVTISRSGGPVWSRQIRTGEAEMCHSRQNIEHHHFKFEQHRRPGDVHVHFFGADCLSFGEGIRLIDGDIMQISFDGFGRALRNPVRFDNRAAKLIEVSPLG
ncbi:MAG: GguC protein [Acidobacteria bacterium]|nr:MAG: GguC protein [Acidobacteriota bacterium]